MELVDGYEVEGVRELEEGIWTYMDSVLWEEVAMVLQEVEVVLVGWVPQEE